MSPDYSDLTQKMHDLGRALLSFLLSAVRFLLCGDPDFVTTFNFLLENPICYCIQFFGGP